VNVKCQASKRRVFLIFRSGTRRGGGGGASFLAFAIFSLGGGNPWQGDYFVRDRATTIISCNGKMPDLAATMPLNVTCYLSMTNL
jgi:hypothetical protein